jgi:hypothetical protein
MASLAPNSIMDTKDSRGELLPKPVPAMTMKYLPALSYSGRLQSDKD